MHIVNAGEREQKIKNDDFVHRTRAVWGKSVGQKQLKCRWKKTRRWNRCIPFDWMLISIPRVNLAFVCWHFCWNVIIGFRVFEVQNSSSHLLSLCNDQRRLFSFEPLLNGLSRVNMLSKPTVWQMWALFSVSFIISFRETYFAYSLVCLSVSVCVCGWC